MITCFFGLPGCGKSTLLAKIAHRELKRIKKGKSPYRYVLSNYYIKGCHKLDFSYLGHVDVSGCLILIDEISLDADSRDYKSFGHELKQFFILHRHYRCDIVYATQQYDGVDRKIRELTHNLYYMKKLGPFSIGTAIFRKITISEESEIKMGYVFPTFVKLLSDLKNTVIICWRPRYYNLFDSFDCPPLKQIEFTEYI